MLKVMETSRPPTPYDCYRWNLLQYYLLSEQNYLQESWSEFLILKEEKVTKLGGEGKEGRDKGQGPTVIKLREKQLRGE